jgi:hypothetical protein
VQRAATSPGRTPSEERTVQQDLDEFVAEANIASLRKQLGTETDETKRQTMCRLLREEEAKLAARLRRPNEPTR